MTPKHAKCCSNGCVTATKVHSTHVSGTPTFHPSQRCHKNFLRFHSKSMATVFASHWLALLSNFCNLSLQSNDPTTWKLDSRPSFSVHSHVLLDDVYHEGTMASGKESCCLDERKVFFSCIYKFEKPEFIQCFRREGSTLSFVTVPAGIRDIILPLFWNVSLIQQPETIPD